MRKSRFTEEQIIGMIKEQEAVRLPENQFKQVWEDGDMIMWANRCAMHRRDGWDGRYMRVHHRTTTLGERPFFRY